MEQLIEYAWLVPVLPLISAALIAAFGKLMPMKGSELGIAAVAIAWLISLGIGWHTFVNAPFEGENVVDIALSPLGGDVVLQLGVYVDGLTAMMFVLVTTVSLMVQVYSREYMHGEDRFTYFFSMLSLFTFSMLVLVVANNTLQAVVGWELVGVCSFLLIGFYWEEKSNQDAANKAFLTTKFADVGLIVGVIVLSVPMFDLVDDGRVFDIQHLVHAAADGQIPTGTIVLGCLMIFLGAVGKSGQMPLHVWLPDAMAGPTPVSALIHAATMVTAGVFLVARLYPVYAQSIVVMNTIAIVGVITLFLAGFVALVQDDIKKVLAYSTVSQLGYMMAALGVGGYTAGIFHLFTHGFFKALLFLGSGSLIHAVHSNNMSDMGGMRKYMPWTFATFIIGSLALAGFPLTAGFFSKDEILVAAQIWESNGFLTGTLVFWLGLAGAMVTTFYMARACFLIFFGEHRGAHHAASTHDEHADEHATIAHAAEADALEDAHATGSHGGGGHHAVPHESGKQIVVPLVTLMVLSFPVGFAGGFLWDEVGGSTEKNFEMWTATEVIEEETYPFLSSGEDHGEDEGSHGDDEEHGEEGAAPTGDGVVAAGTLAAGGEEGKIADHILHGAPTFHADVFWLALGGFLISLGLAWSIYGRGKPDEDPTFKLGPVSTLLVNKYYLDDLGYRFIVVPVRDKAARLAYWSNQEVLDSAVKGVGGITKALATSTYRTLDQKVIDGSVNGAAFSAAWWSDKLKRVQSGNVQRYAGALIAGVIVLVLVFAAAA